MILEVGIAQHRLWRHVLACGAHTCMLIPLEGIMTARNCSIIQELRINCFGPGVKGFRAYILWM